MSALPPAPDAPTRPPTADAAATPLLLQPPETPAPERLGQLSGDRICTRCAFNLHGQPIVREPHYGLVMVQCPECGTPAALQEYPLPGRWMGKLTGAIIVAWLGALLILTCITIASMIGISNQAHQIGTRELARAIAVEHKAYQDERVGVGGNTYWFNTYAPEQSWVDSLWAVQADKAAIMRAAGRIFDAGAAAKSMARNSIWLVVFGVLWSVALMHIRRTRIGLAALVLLGLALTIVLLDLFNSSWGFVSAGQIAAEWAGPTALYVLIGVTAAPLAIGMIIGRPVVRLIIRALLPPRLRIPFSILWTTDGLPPPRIDPARLVNTPAT